MKNRLYLRKELLEISRLNDYVVGAKCVLLKKIDDWIVDYPTFPKGTAVEIIENKYNNGLIMFRCYYHGLEMEWGHEPCKDLLKRIKVIDTCQNEII